MAVNKQIMIIGAGWEQQPLIYQAKKCGLSVIVTDPHRNAEGFRYADEKYIVNPRDLEKLESIFKIHNPDGVISDACDYSHFAVSYLTQKYDLPGPKIDSALVVANKYLQRKIASDYGIPQPDYRLCFRYCDVVNAANEIGFPIVIKPLDNRGSIGIGKVNSHKELKKAFLNALTNSHSRELIVERFIEGQVVTVEGIYTDKFYNLSFSTKRMHPKFQLNAMQLTFPGDLSTHVREKLYSLNKRLVDGIGIDFGLTHTEFIVNDENIHFVEIANRGGGVNISNKILPSVTGIDTSLHLIRLALGQKLSLQQYFPFPDNRCCILHFFDFGNGRVKSVSGLKKAMSHKGVIAIRLNVRRGDTIGDLETALNRPGFAIFTGTNRDECLQRILELDEILKIKVE